MHRLHTLCGLAISVTPTALTPRSASLRHGDFCVPLVVRVTGGAMGSGSVPCRNTAPAQAIDLNGHGFQMVRVDTRTVGASYPTKARRVSCMAEMIEIEAIRNWSAMSYVDQSVSPNGALPIPADAVSPLVNSQLPDPAARLRIDQIVHGGRSQLVMANEPLRLTSNRTATRIGCQCRLRRLTTSALAKATRNGRILVHRVPPVPCATPRTVTRRGASSRQFYHITDSTS